MQFLRGRASVGKGTCIEINQCQLVACFLHFQHKKKAADNCGPMCDCADSCLVAPAEEVSERISVVFCYPARSVIRLVKCMQ